MELDELVKTILTAIGGGSITAASGYGAIRWHLGRLFPSRSEFEALQELLAEQQKEIDVLTGVTSDQRSQIEWNSEQLRGQWERIAENVIGPLRELTTAIQQIRIDMGVQSTHLGHLRDEMERLRQ